MIKSKSIERVVENGWKQRLSDFNTLVKGRLTALVLFTSVMAMLIAAEGVITMTHIVVLLIGGFLVTGAANTLNQVLEKDYDKMMKRTENRPLATGRMNTSTAVMLAGFMAMFGISALALFNPWAAFLGMMALVSYSFVYTPMKRISPTAVLIGAVPGALPMMIGTVAVQGEITVLAIALFAVQFLWQMPHFWAIAWLGHEDYMNAGFKLLPAEDKQDRNTGLQSLIYALLLIPVSLVPFYLGVTGFTSMVAMVILGIGYAYFALNFYKNCDRKSARQLMFSSFFYLPVALIFLLADKI